MSDLNKLCCNPWTGTLVYKRGDGRLVFKAKSYGWTQISFSWDAKGSDLDICAQWTDGGPVVGFGYNSDSGDYSTGSFGLRYSGDIRGPSSSEWIGVRRNPWGGNLYSFKVNLNFYGYNSSSAPTSTCTVIASQEGGETIIRSNVSCGTHAGGGATISDPGVIINFDGEGKLLSIETI